MNEYAIIWFEGSGAFTLVDDNDKTVLLTLEQARNESADVLSNEKDVDDAEPGVRYAIPAQMLDTLFGWEV